MAVFSSSAISDVEVETIVHDLYSPHQHGLKAISIAEDCNN